MTTGLMASGSAFAFPEPYCVRGYGSGVEPITSVAIDGINKTSPTTGGAADEDFTATTGALAPGGSYPITVGGNTGGNFTDAVVVYVDWNQNGTFDADEGYFVGTLNNTTGADGKTVASSVSVPAGATLGNTRMRVTKQYLSGAATGTPADAPACGTTGFGQAEDYTVNISTSAPVPPSLSMAFSPTNTPVGTPSTLTLTIGNTSAAAMNLTADFTNTLPTGLTLATPAAASSTCAGTLTAADGGNSITLANGGSVPIGGCTISAKVSAAASGIFINTIAAGALVTDQGSAGGASATYEATQGGTAVSYSTGFESPFTVGTINGQQGWAARSVNVATTMPANGTQHLGITSTASPTTSNYALAISPTTPVGTTTHAAISANLRLSRLTNGAFWRFNPQDPAAGKVMTYVQFEPTAQKIQAITFDASGNGTFVDTGATYTADTYFSIKAIVDRSTGALTLCKDGQQIYQDTSGNSTAARNIGNVAISQVAGSGQTANNTFFADDLKIEYTNSSACDGSISTHTVTSSVGTPSGTITPLGAQTVADGGSVSFTLTPDSGFHVDNVGGTCVGSLAGSAYTVNNVAADCTVVANFAADAGTDHTVTPSVGTGSGTIDPSTPQTVADGGSISFTLTADSGFQIGTVGGTCGGTLSGSTYTTSAVTADCTVVANFTAISGPPVASITPASLSFSVAQNSTGSNPLTIANTGGGNLTFSITEALASRAPVRDGAPSMTSSRESSPSAGTTPRRNPQPMAVAIDEGFDNLETLVATGGWIRGNRSNPLGQSTWAQCGGSAIPPAFDGSANSCALVNFNSTTGAGTISNWLLTKEITFAPGTTGSFYTRTGGTAQFADRLEVRVCTSGDCTNFGTGATDVGNYTSVLLTINPNLVSGADPTGVNGYPTSWTQFTIPNLPTSGTGRIAFRYFVTSGGPDGDNSNIIGLDRLVVNTGTVTPTGCTNPSDVPWLSASPSSGSVAAGANTPVTVSVNTNGLAAGSYAAHVCVATNDTANPSVDVPVSLTVTGGATTHVVTPSVGTGTGTISPSTPQTVNDNQTTSFTLTAGSGFQIGSVTGTCGGSLNAGVFTTAAVTADCTVIANFTATGGGVVCSNPINHSIATDLDGSYFGWVSGQVSDDSFT
ncbi:choice-of-anchor J domain-containing protein, partial [Dokdonella sp.]|uniref:choice-of-anchor J domain-containing protein n=1 Tax=Dokdonella sp. TaxID=2291710 RepID=UPI001B0C875F